MDKPIRGCRRVIIRWSYKFLTYNFQLFANFCVTTWKRVPKEEVNFYEEWLGPLEEQEKEQRGENPMMEIHRPFDVPDNDQNIGVRTRPSSGQVSP